jgi:twitching motility protein PilI
MLRITSNPCSAKASTKCSEVVLSNGSIVDRSDSSCDRTVGFRGVSNWFVALEQVSEVVPVPQPMAVPLTKPWFRGVANVRGKLYSIVDFAQFQGGEPIGGGMERRVVLISEKLVGGAGIVVSRMLGLRNPEQFTPVARPADAAPWIKGVFTDAADVEWTELDLPVLAQEPRFLEVGA